MNVVQKSSPQGVSFDKVVHPIRETNDFASFKKMEGNRMIRPEHVRRLTASIKKNGMLVKPILVNAKREVIDGQHLLAAAEIAESFVYYVVIENMGLGGVRTLNSNKQNWTRKDYINEKVEQGILSYIKLEKFIKVNPEFNFTDCIKLCSNRTSVEYSKSSRTCREEHVRLGTKGQVFNEGTWTGKDFELAQDWANKIKLVYPYYKGCFKKKFVRAMIDLINF
jgi:hypothetical protein